MLLPYLQQKHTHLTKSSVFNQIKMIKPIIYTNIFNFRQCPSVRVCK